MGAMRVSPCSWRSVQVYVHARHDYLREVPSMAECTRTPTHASTERQTNPSIATPMHCDTSQPTSLLLPWFPRESRTHIPYVSPTPQVGGCTV